MSARFLSNFDGRFLTFCRLNNQSSQEISQMEILISCSHVMEMSVQIVLFEGNIAL